MKKFGLIVIGAGSGLNVSSAAADKGIKVAVVENGPMGGTCLNRGCIPSKMLIHSADVAEIIKSSKKFGIESKINKINFRKIVDRVSKIVDKDAKGIEEGIKADKNTTLYKTEGKFVGFKTLKVGKETITADKIVIAAGTRPFIPKIEGLSDVDFITSDGALRLKKLPKTMTVIGGGYIAAELAHFFGSLGAKITIIQHNELLVPNEDIEIAEKFTEIFRKKYNVLLGYNAVKVSRKGKNFVVIAEKNGKKKKIISEQLLVAAGRIPNTDILDVKKTDVRINDRGFVNVNEFMETNVKGVWALGDIAGKFLFKHSANLEANYVYNNIFHEKRKIDYRAMPHAIFTSPQIAGVGYTERELKEKKISYAIGKYSYMNTGMGLALQDKDGFVKILAHKKTRKILGCHIIGTDASTLIQEVIVAMKSGNGTVDNIRNAVHVHPALSEVVQRAVNDIEL
ncbi:dihydrolipoyl dehydrogenase [Candidatus Woesearchaeota archaeon]|nr:dihydrolipoyl dehydrogenase [Candidatus Woesearchaeota archaeon]